MPRQGQIITEHIHARSQSVRAVEDPSCVVHIIMPFPYEILIERRGKFSL